MKKTIQHISLKKSTVKGKAPDASVLAEGELAANIFKGTEKIYLKNGSEEVVSFSPDGTHLPLSGGTVSGDTEFNGDVKIVYPDSSSQTVSLREVMVDNEMTISAALNDLNTRNNELSAKVTEQKTDIDNLKAKEYLPLSGGTVSGITTFTNDVKVAYPDSSSTPVSLREVMVGNEKTTAAALNDLNTRNNELSAKVTEQKTDIDNLKAKEYLPLSGGTVTGDATFTKDVKVVFPNSETPTSLVGAIVSNEKVTAAALNDLNEKVNSNKYLPLSGGTITGNLDVDGSADFSRGLHVNSEEGIISSHLTADTLTSDGSLQITAVESIESASYGEGVEVEVWTTDGNTKPLSDFLQTSGGTVSGITTFTNDVKIAYPDSSSTPVSLRKVMVDNEEVIAAALNDLNDKVANISIINAPLIIKDGNKKYNVNIAKGVELGLFTEIQ